MHLDDRQCTGCVSGADEAVGSPENDGAACGAWELCGVARRYVYRSARAGRQAAASWPSTRTWTPHAAWDAWVALWCTRAALGAAASRRWAGAPLRSRRLRRYGHAPAELHERESGRSGWLSTGYAALSPWAAPPRASASAQRDSNATSSEFTIFTKFDARSCVACTPPSNPALQRLPPRPHT